MNEKTHQANKNNLLNWSKAETNTWHPNFNEECEATFSTLHRTIHLISKNEKNVRKGFTQNITLKDDKYTYILLCELKVTSCTKPASTALPCGAYIAVYNIGSKETKRTLRYDIPTDGWVRLKLPFLIINKRMQYRVGVYIDGVCDAEFRKIRLVKGDYHGFSFADGEEAM